MLYSFLTKAKSIYWQVETKIYFNDLHCNIFYLALKALGPDNNNNKKIRFIKDLNTTKKNSYSQWWWVWPI